MSAWQQVLRVAMVLAFPCAAAAADDFPHRQAGSWETTIEVSGKSATTRQCVGDATDRLINAMQPPAGGTCSNSRFVVVPVAAHACRKPGSAQAHHGGGRARNRLGYFSWCWNILS